MTDVRFYHLTRSRLEAVLPVMLEKTLERKQRAVVMAGSQERVEALTGHLWTWQDRGFLPHGSEKDGFAEDQPVWLTARDENPNGAQVLFLTDGATSERLAAYDVCAILFDGADEAAVATARESWRAYKAAGHEVTYWQQGEGGWDKQA
ncbi:MAG: DNA polymerase III subunit chi [Kiloniellales bacterium]|jgi:DNA polymerase-3 subunit chi|nr:DNA polymerase III subunit chi [Kiloniellales bacterium]